MTVTTKTSDWTFLERPLTEPIEGAIGFIYKITNLKTGRKYIGQKVFYNKLTRPPLKGKTKKRRDVKESDWRKYWGSSEELKLDVLKLGEENFTREVLFGCPSKAYLNYQEARLQFVLEVLFKPDEYYNNIINIRLNGNQLRGNGGAVILQKVAKQKTLPSSQKS